MAGLHGGRRGASVWLSRWCTLDQRARARPGRRRAYLELARVGAARGQRREEEHQQHDERPGSREHCASTRRRRRVLTSTPSLAAGCMNKIKISFIALPHSCVFPLTSNSGHRSLVALGLGGARWRSRPRPRRAGGWARWWASRAQRTRCARRPGATLPRWARSCRYIGARHSHARNKKLWRRSACWRRGLLVG